MKVSYLTTSFRCSQAVITEAKWRAPDMEWPEWAVTGSVNTKESWVLDDIPDGSAVICRNNAPLFSLALEFLKEGRYPELSGRDVIKGLITQMKKFGKTDTSQEQALGKLAAWFTRESKRARDSRQLQDKRQCMEIFITQGSTLGKAIALAKALEQQSGRIKLMTGHKAKGLEFDDVFFLDPQLCGKKDQEKNIRYVIQTRAKNNLTYIHTETLQTKEYKTS